MEIGKLRHKISLLKREVAQDDIGQSTAEYTPFCEAWSSVEPLTFKETLAVGSERAEITVRMRMRYLPNITADMRVVHNEKTYEIVSLLDRDLRHIELELICEVLQ